MDFSPFEVWAGMEVLKKTLRAFDTLDIVAHSLWEMTYHGFEEEDIASKGQELWNAASGAEEDKSPTP